MQAISQSLALNAFYKGLALLKCRQGRTLFQESAPALIYFFKADILAGLVTYSTDKRLAANLETISAARAHEVIRMNRQGEKPLTLPEEGNKEVRTSIDLAEQDDLTRFDTAKSKRSGRKQRKGNNNNNDNRQRNRQRRNGEGKNN